MNIFTEQPKLEIKAGVLFLRRKRPGFDPEWGEKIEMRARRQLQSSEFAIYIPEAEITDIMSLRSALDECHTNSCQILIAVQPTISDGRMSPLLGQYSLTPVVFWATPEKQEGDMVSACSLVGSHNFIANLVQSGRKFDFVYGMPGNVQTVKDLNSAVYRAYAYSAISGSNAGLVGYHAPGFIDMHVDAASLRENLNVELFHIGIQEFIGNVESVDDGEARNDVAKVEKLGIRKLDAITAKDMLLASKYYLAIKKLMDTMPLRSLGIRDWPELSGKHWPYLAMTRLASEGYAITCEGDVDGALSYLMGHASGCGPCYLSDWLEHDEHHVTLWHMGFAPLQLCEGLDSHLPPEIGLQCNNRRPAVVNATLKTDMPVTLFRLWHLNGKYLFTAIEGETVKPKRHLMGTNGAARFNSVNIRKYFRKLLGKGFPHHPVIAEGHVREHLYILAQMFNLECVD